MGRYPAVQVWPSVTASVSARACTSFFDPGRFLVGNGGILVTEVQYMKEGPGKTFIVADAGMNDLIRPALYSAYQEVVAVRETSGTVTGDVVGPICESGDFLAADRSPSQ